MKYVFHLRSNISILMRFLLITQLGLRASSRVPNTSKQMKAVGLRPRVFICSEVFGTRDEALALVFDILLLDFMLCLGSATRKYDCGLLLNILAKD